MKLRILETLKDLISEEVIELSVGLVNQFKALDGYDIADKKREIEEREWELSELCRKNIYLGRTGPEAHQVAMDLSRATQERRALSFQYSSKRNVLLNSLWEITLPIINNAWILIDNTILMVKSLRKSEMVEKKSEYVSSGNRDFDRAVYTVMTNRERIGQAVEMLLDLKIRLQNSKFLSVEEIFRVIGEAEAVIGKIDFSKMENVEMLQIAWDEEREIVRGPTIQPLPIPSQDYYSQMQKPDEVIAKAKKAIAESYAWLGDLAGKTAKVVREMKKLGYR